MGRRLFVDLDGVLADFYGFYSTTFGVQIEQNENGKEFWDNVRNHGTFYRDQPLMDDALDLWHGLKKFNIDPVILTGIPRSIPNVALHKRLWVDQHISPFVRLITCRSADKKVYGMPGDILIDDRLKYSHLWVEMGGIFVHHTSAQDTLRQLAALYNPPVTRP